ncbi:hypothetical protein BGZ76_003261 [Entomortierella beljakovae]|nr:hypothetical protein BGZ76_003261 [Entomortierella beljakovae]
MTCLLSRAFLKLTLVSLAIVLLNVVSAQDSNWSTKATAQLVSPDYCLSELQYPYFVVTTTTVSARIPHIILHETIKNKGQHLVDWAINDGSQAGFSVEFGGISPAIVPPEVIVMAKPDLPSSARINYATTTGAGPCNPDCLCSHCMEQHSMFTPIPTSTGNDNYDNSILEMLLAPHVITLQPVAVDLSTNHQSFISTEIEYTVSFDFSYTLATIPTMKVTPFLELPAPSPSTPAKPTSEFQIKSDNSINIKTLVAEPPAPVPESSPTIGVTPPTPVLLAKKAKVTGFFGTANRHTAHNGINKKVL